MIGLAWKHQITEEGKLQQQQLWALLKESARLSDSIGLYINGQAGADMLNYIAFRLGAKQ